MTAGGGCDGGGEGMPILTQQCLLSCLRPKIFRGLCEPTKALGLFTPSTKTGSHFE